MDLALFDLDETLIDDDSASLWVRWLVAEGFAPAELERQEQLLMQSYYQGQLSMEDYMQATLVPLVGLSTQTVAGWVQRYIRRDILPRVYPAARERMQWHRERGDCILVISATGEHLVAPIAEQLGADGALAIGVEVAEGRFTGNTYGTMTYQQGKVIRLQQWLQQHPELQFAHSHGYSDSINDKAMLEYVDSATVINPNSDLGALAELHGWEVCHWER
ncbi:MULTISPECIES: HAD family phosphatase [Serratia]|jgi:HAD superfamily hydrolase (TIGR01490 family)|uniref:HAD family hydrolase n=1 Tax=Serratia fonticola TaxID=47917 RepID=A0A1Q5VGW7_SERFO|nr:MULTISPECIES: HAD family hydrolase [Serratia]MBC3216108.1 HAD-IB family hydrolase [Serratia fonticola]MBC3229615.1 HAD-IB family hydrolase [Serratia fonticola]NBJ33737.1 HAD-IB family hydrolase [Serratia fonticola]OKP29621.1 hydrolase [Serratia fonticola]QKJ61493.1 HAD-IB family hydrolase [Serratia fonticola]